MSRKLPVTVGVVGMSELLKAMEELGAEVVSKKGGVSKSAMLAAGRAVKARMVNNAPQSPPGKGTWIGRGTNRRRGEPGRLKRSIKHFRNKNPRYLSELVHVGPMLGTSRDDPNGAWYAAIVEFYGGKGGKGKGYMRNSIDPHEDTNTIRRALATGIERKAKEIGNENARQVARKVKNYGNRRTKV